MHSAAELQKAIVGALGADSGVDALVGGRILDHAPANVAFPYITFGRTSIHDWSTATEGGSEQIFTLHVWSKGRGKREALAIMAAAGGVLHEGALDLEGHALVNLRLELSEIRYDERNEAYQGVLRFRAITEPI